METKNVRLDGLKGTWHMVASYTGLTCTYYEWESEQLGENCPSVVTDETLGVLDGCESGIYTAVQKNLLF